jgi:Do/DeqQ family serine protease
MLLNTGSRSMLRIIVMSFLLFVGVAQAQEATPTSRAEMQLTFAPIVKRTSPAVVNVYAQRIERQRESALLSDPFFRRFFGEDGDFGRPRERVANSLGSGVIVDDAGFIVTNNHVIANGVDIRVVLSDRREFEAKLLLADERTDLAILKIEPGDEKLPMLNFADSDNLEVGDLVLAIGNPFGVGQTVTSGIVSALARTQVGITDYQFFIQTDAAINPGNSGGALVNMNGELVGINTAIFSRSGGSIGIGFSIPSNMVKTVVASAQGGSNRVKRPWLGGDFQDVTADVAESLGMARPEGTLVVELHPQSPLLAAGLKRGDVILGIDGRTVENSREFGFRVGTAQIGETRIVEYRRGEKEFEARVQLIAAPETTPRDETLIDSQTPFAGLVIANLSPALAEEVGYKTTAEGVVVLDIKGGPSARLFRKGDALLSINQRDIKTVADVKELTAERQPRWLITVLRGNRKITLRFRG